MTDLTRRQHDLAWAASFFDQGHEHSRVLTETGGVQICAISSPKHPFCMVVTSGLAELDLVAVHPQELFVTVLDTQWQGAQFILEEILRNVRGRGKALVYGDVVSADGPILNGTGIVGVVADPNVYLPQESNFRLSSDGEIETQFMNLVPLTSAEVAFLEAGERDTQLDALADAFGAQDIEALDLRRPSLRLRAFPNHPRG